tara:strand:+ start:1371 stop:1889 length:519 start_codon:yes stop_codon:yes gene_type:complete
VHRILRSTAVVSALLLALTGCDRPAVEGDPARPAGFSHDISQDQSGYYIPLAPVRAGDWSINHLFLGQTADFTAWEAGAQGSTFAPVMIEFEDAAGRRTRALPTRYTVTDTVVHFEGQSAQLGTVVFDGRLDADAVATAKRNLGDEGAVLTGTLRVGGKSLGGVRFRWWAGD